MSVAPPEQLAEVTRRLADTGVAVTVLPATDLFLMGRDQDCGVRRGVLDAHRLIPHGVTCTLSSNNILNPFTPFGDGSLIRMANMYANIAQASKPADIVVFDAASPEQASPEQAVAEVIAPEAGFKAGRRTFTRPAGELHRPG